MPRTDTSSFGVSRETDEKLRAFAEAVRRWTRAINLVSEATVEAIWQRHVLDALQLIKFAPLRAERWCDMGSGAGFPGIVIAIVNQERDPGCDHILIESDSRKAAFLTLQAKALGLTCEVVCERLENATPVSADVISARALAPLPKLLSYALRHAGPRPIFIFPKGKGAEAEVELSRREFNFDVAFHQSETDPQGAILVITNLAPRGKIA